MIGESISSSAGDETQALKGSSSLESLWQCLGWAGEALGASVSSWDLSSWFASL